MSYTSNIEKDHICNYIDPNTSNASKILLSCINKPEVVDKSGCNYSSKMRRAIYLTYNSISDGDLRTHYYNNRIPETTNLNWVSNIGHFQGTVIKD